MNALEVWHNMCGSQLQNKIVWDLGDHSALRHYFKLTVNTLSTPEEVGDKKKYLHHQKSWNMKECAKTAKRSGTEVQVTIT